MECFFIFAIGTFSLCLFLLCLLGRRRPKELTIGLFHPYADAGGGGERVLWHSVAAILREWPLVRIIIYTGDPVRSKPSHKIIEKAVNRFGIDLPQERIEFVRLRLRTLIEATTWPRFTLLGQCLGSLLLGAEALLRARPHILFDTMGYAFIYPLFRLMSGCPVIAYVHYPIVSTDMLKLVQSSITNFNNNQSISRSKTLTNIKIFYYRVLAYFYGVVGRRANVTMVNSTWTYGHISSLWRKEGVVIVYPPCDVETFSNIKNKEKEEEEFRIVTIGQYRPEKNHQQQLEILRNLLDKPRPQDKKPVLVMIGSCRDEGDHARVESLRKKAVELGVIDNVQLLVNVSFKRLLTEIGHGDVAIHTMINEHFGISLVECIAAGCIMIAHRSGGPKHDIVIEGDIGYLAESTEEFTEYILDVMRLSDEEKEGMRGRGVTHVKEQFSVSCFECSIIKHLGPIVGSINVN